MVTAAGRYILSEMQHIANKEYGFQIIYGDTDSLFLHNVTDNSLTEFQQKFKEKYHIELEIKNRYDTLLLSAGKKHYIGIEKGVLDNVGFEGEKNDRPEFYHMVYDKLVNNIMIDEIDPLPNIRKAFSDLDCCKVDSNLLAISQKVGRDPDNYVVTARVGRIARAVNAKEGDLIRYWNSDKKKMGNSWTLDPAQIDIAKYKELLWNTVREILDIEGCSVSDLAKEFGIKIKGQGRKKSNKKKTIFEDYSIVLNKENSIGGEK